MSKYNECSVGWKQIEFMVKKSLFQPEMGWKQSLGKDNYQEDDENEEEIRKLEAIEVEDMSCLRTVTLEQVGKWKNV